MTALPRSAILSKPGHLVRRPAAGVPVASPRAQVLLVAPYAPGGGGMGRMMQYFIAAEAGAPGLSFRAIESRGEGRAAASAVHTVGAACRIARAAVSGRRTVVHVNVAEGLSVVRKGLLLFTARLLGTPVVLHLHAAEIMHFHERLPAVAQAAMRAMFRAASVCVVLGTPWQDWLIATLGVDPLRIEIVRNGVPDPDITRRRRAGGRFRFVFIGNLLPRKGLPDLLHALSDPRLAALDWHLTVAGGGERAALVELADELKLGARVRFAGWLDREETTWLLAGADTLVLPSYHEGLPLVVLEALSLGIPVITTTVGVIPETLTDGIDALLVAPGDRAALTHAALRMMSDSGLAASLGQAGRALYDRHFTMHAFTESMLRVYARHCGLVMAAS